MRRTFSIVALFPAALVAAAVVGCGDNSPGVMVKPTPNGGAMTRLKRDLGFFSIKAEGPGGAAARKKNATRSIVVVFFGPDAVTPMDPPPTDVVVNLGPDGKTTPVPLKPDDKTPGRFVSAPGPYPAGLQGEVRLKVGGEEVGESFSAM